MDLTTLQPLLVAQRYRVLPWLAARGISPEVAERWGVGFDPGYSPTLSGRVTIPVFQPYTGDLLSISGRAAGAEEPKYIHTSYAKQRTLFSQVGGFVGCVALVEGQIDCLQLTEAGVPAAAVIGSSDLSPWQIGLLKRWADTVIVWADKDGPGRQAAQRWSNRLKQSGFRVVIGPYVGESTDPDLLARTEPEFVRQIYEAAASTSARASSSSYSS